MSHLNTSIMIMAAQNQLYTSQKTCLSLKERVDSQRRDPLRLSVGAAIKDNERKIQQQDDEIKGLRSQLEYESNKVKDQIQQMKFLEAELKDVQLWKEKNLEERTQLTLSKQMQNDHEQQIELLTLKLEAAELAAKTRGENTNLSARRRAEQLKLELENVRAKYAKLSIRLAEADDTEDVSKQQKQKQIREDMDQAIQLAFQTALKSVEDEWKEKYQLLQQQLQEAIKHNEAVDNEREVAVDCLKEVSTRDEQQHFKEELTDQLTAELTEKITVHLTEELTGKIEKRLRKKYKRMQRELESKAHSDDDNQQILQSEIKKIKEQYKSEYANKIEELQQQNVEQLKKQKERMRKLVRALLEREAKENKKSSKSNKSTSGSSDTGDQKLEKRRIVTGANNSDEDIVTTSALSSAKKRRSQSGLPPFRGSAVK